MSISVTYRKDYQAPNFAVDQLYLDVHLFDDHTIVNSRLQLSRVAPGPLLLMGDDLTLVSIASNGQYLSEKQYTLEEGNIKLEDMPDQLELSIVTKIYPQKNTKLSGLYKSRNLFCTQCESEGFRAITFYPDRPDVLTKFTTRISADKKQYPVLLSNGNLIDKGDEEQGRHWVVWEDPFKKPSYLFALVAGNLACVKDTFKTASGRTVDLRIYVEPGNEGSCGHAMDSLKRSMLWDEKVYGREYDLDIFMIVAVSDFNMGAMENKGLNIFNDKFILAKPETATDVDFADIEGVVAHEYFHNWTGNRVTCRDWFQLSLKEGLTVFRDQEFSRDMHSRDVNRILDVNILRNVQFPEDAGKMAHPVRPESYQEISNFYTATVYNKGAEVIRMQHTLLGEKGFRKGMDLYFDRHDGQAVTIDDFVAAMEDANKVDLTQFKHWYSQAGTPEIAVKTRFENDTLSLTLSQTCPPTPECQDKKPFHIPIAMALLGKSGQELQASVLELKEKEQTFIFKNLKEKPVISLLRDFSAPVILHFDQSEADLLILLRFETNGFAKWDASRRLMRNTMLSWLKNPANRGEIPPALLQALREILIDTELNDELKAEILTPLSFEDVVSGMKDIDVTKIEYLRDSFRDNLGLFLYEDAKKIYQSLWKAEDHAINSKAFGRRKLRNICLYYMMKAQTENALSFAQEQYKTAKTMTDQIAALTLVAHSDNIHARQQVLDDFYQQWSANDLVIDKWFTIQATSDVPDALEHVKKLMQHPAFSITNPNRVRALIAAFMQNNLKYFHAEDGSGYVFLREILQKLDTLNPQIASRLATPFTRWQRFDDARKEKMQEQLRILSQTKLSADLAEMVNKSLV